MKCQNNMKQITLAAHNYDSAVGYLPPGFLGTDATNGGIDSDIYPGYSEQNVGVLVHLLPYVEQDNLYRLLMAGVPSDYLSPDKRYSGYFAYSSMWSNRTAVIKSFLCPSDNAQKAPWDAWFATSTQNGIRIVTFQDGSFGRTNYIGVAGYYGFSTDTYRGVFSNRTRVPLGTIPDGTSNTLCFGEYSTKGPPTSGWQSVSASWIAAGMFPTAWGMVQSPAGPDPYWYCFSSKHSGTSSSRCDTRFDHLASATVAIPGPFVYASAILTASRRPKLVLIGGTIYPHPSEITCKAASFVRIIAGLGVRCDNAKTTSLRQTPNGTD